MGRSAITNDDAEVLVGDDVAGVTSLAGSADDQGTRRTIRYSGRLLEIDYRDRTAELWDQLGHKMVVRFDADKVQDVDVARCQFVTIEGETLAASGDRPTEVKLKSITVHRDFGAFWNNNPAGGSSGNGCPPFPKPRDLSATFWEDDDIDEFLTALRQWRRGS